MVKCHADPRPISESLGKQLEQRADFRVRCSPGGLTTNMPTARSEYFGMMDIRAPAAT